MSDAAAEIARGLQALGEQFKTEFARADNEPALRQARAGLLGKKGELTRLLKLMAEVAPEQRQELGAQANQARKQVEDAFAVRLEELHRAAREADLNAAPFDLTLPGRSPALRGHLHPVNQVLDEMMDIFAALGFQWEWGPEVEFESNNFTKLNFPPDHPATDMQDTFWVRVQGGRDDDRVLLRTHTSNVQSRVFSTRTPPFAVVSAGRVYRRDDDVTHSPMFHQIEGFLVDEGISFAHLKGVLTEFAERFYGKGTPVRFRPSFFPFVEPGAELDVGCVFCSEGESRRECRVCKGTGWLEVLGCGMTHPRVYEACGIDGQRFSGFAFGMGVERTAMLRYGIPDIRLLFENHPRFLAQF